jgi:hypothetical protein
LKAETRFRIVAKHFMHEPARALSLFIFSLAFCLTGCKHTESISARRAAATAALKAGLAQVDITPPLGFRMAGYFTERLATGVHDPLRAKALFLQQGKEQAVLVFCDLVEVKLSVTKPARQMASRKTGIPYEDILICATHTHTGPLYDDVRSSYFHQAALMKSGKDAAETIDYPQFLSERLAQVIVEAKANAKPVELEAAVAKQEGLSFNRRFWMKNGRVQFNPGILNTNIVRPAGPTDPDLGIIAIRPLNRTKPSAVATVFAMHCDTIGGTEYSADYPFFLEQTVQKALGTNAVVMFGAGTCGDINHINVNKQEPFKGFERSEYLGATLGKTVSNALPNLKRITRPALAVRSKTTPIALQEPNPKLLTAVKEKIKLPDASLSVEDCKALDLEKRRKQGKAWPVQVQAIRLDDETAVVGLPGEVFVELGLAIKKASPFKNTIVISICNDRPNYVPTKKAFSEGSYEVTNSRLVPGAGEKMVDMAVKLLNGLRRK